MCLANGLLYSDVSKCKDCNKSKQDEENDCDDLVKEEEKSVCYDSDYSNHNTLTIQNSNIFNSYSFNF